MALQLIVTVLFERVIAWMAGGGSTKIAKGRVALNAGTPLSLTVMANSFDPSCESAGVHANRPFVALRLAPAAAPGPRLNVRSCGGRSGSVALAPNVTRAPAWTARFGMGANDGAWFTGVTVIVKVCEALVSEPPLAVPPLSCNWTVTVAEPPANAKGE